MRHLPKATQIQRGLLGALALQTTITDQGHARQQGHLLPRSHYLNRPIQPGPPAILPPNYEPTPHSLAWEHNVRAFLALLSGPGHSNNPYNDHTAFAHAPVLAGGWIDAPTQWQIAPGRHRTDNNCLVGKFERILAACGGFNKQFPVLLDRQGRVLDGGARLEALKNLNADKPTGAAYYRVYILQLDF